MNSLQSLQTVIPGRPHTSYRGRFAPSPSGLLHFGSLVAALASFLQAKSKQGKWLVRIEDIDKPRELIGADKEILKTLEAYGLYWDEEVLYQSNQAELYNEVLNHLQHNQLSYNCHCTRAQIKQSGGVYLGTCKDLNLPAEGAAIRLKNQFPYTEFIDGLQGKVIVNSGLAKEDFIIHRRDGLFAYQLAVVVDDIYQGITEVVRGCDLLEPTARQLTLFKTLNAHQPNYLHVPLAITEQGYKLSKQNAAPAIDNNNPQPALIQALQFLGQNPEPALMKSSVDEIIQWAISNWQVNSIPKKQEIML
ncbi:tRNA glutamyl-Q(34) synthetase GluQRS [Thalassomonas sp. M1454]|uniref:tRNA glutamyl-Q(34) synthetase GluQRS n=1 Tax=Thalassomonas sp. M1454 TaxID=2594477 RepID=UPI0011815007|nr:tRNA glutamyl-Q(34) synthetase GluQRS [Thalassomonas sp. M1454]TRX52470.1 tRNA glutamyl-Q(34) synthetase GluQRS [Thalassomonas sp. M1454]